MIGQKRLQQVVLRDIESGVFPRCSLFCGPFGSGKRTFVQQIGTWMRVQEYVAPDVRVDTVRQIIDQAYKLHSPMIYVLPNIDVMSVIAKNALLKVTEEPPNNAYFVLTAEDAYSKVLDTLRSRATCYVLDAYTPEEIEQYYKSVAQYNSVDARILKDICTTPGDVNTALQYGVQQLQEFIAKVVDNVAEVSGANALKIANSLRLTEKDTEGIDLQLFWKVCVYMLMQRQEITAVQTTSRYLAELSKGNRNKQMLFDMWIFDVRRALYGE